MTIVEAKQRFGVKSYITNQGDTLTKIVDRLYNDRSFQYFYIITELNPHIDWSPVSNYQSTLMPYGVEIFYLAKEACSQVYEVTG